MRPLYTLAIVLLVASLVACGSARAPLPPPIFPLSVASPLPPSPPPTPPPAALELPRIASFVLPCGVEVHVVVRTESTMGEVALLAGGGALGDTRLVEDDVVLVDLLEHELESSASIDERGLFVHTPEVGVSTVSHAAALLQFMREHNFERRDVTRAVRAETEERVVHRGRLRHSIEFDLQRRFYGPSAHTTWNNPARNLDRVSAETVNARLRQLASPASLTLVVVGPYNPALVESALVAATTSWPEAAHATPRTLTVPTFPPAHPQALGYGVVGEMGHIQMMEAGPGSFTTDHAAYRVAVRILGGMYSSRPNAILREERRESYGAYASIREEAGYATMRFYVSVRVDQLNAALGILTSELARLGREESLSEDEVERARALELSAERHRFDDPSAAAEAILVARAEGTTIDAYSARFERLRRVRRSDVARVAHAWIRPTSAPIAVMGGGTWMATHQLSAPGGYELAP